MRHSKVLSLFFAASALLVWACSSDDAGQSDAGGDAAPDVTADVANDVGTVDASKDVAQDTTVLDAPSDVTEAGEDADADDGSLDAGNDADALAPEGTPCAPPDDVQQQGCGFCGTQYRACLPDDDGGFVWGSWGYCQGEVVNGCDPNQTYPDIACGNCGTQKQVCLSNCSFDLTQACIEPLNACKPGSTDFQLGLSCDGGGRERTCDDQCSFGNWGACEDGPSIPVLEVPSTVGTVNSLVQTLDPNKKIKHIYDDTCPTTLSSTMTSYNYIRVENATGQEATVSIWHSAVNNDDIDTLMAVYPGMVPPADNDDSARENCTGYATDSCDDESKTPTSCASSWAGLMVDDGKGVTIAAGASVVLYSGAWFSSDSGDFQINVETESLQ